MFIFLRVILAYTRLGSAQSGKDFFGPTLVYARTQDSVREMRGAILTGDFFRFVENSTPKIKNKSTEVILKMEASGVNQCIPSSERNPNPHKGLDDRARFNTSRND
jgi:hypothetical protein